MIFCLPGCGEISSLPDSNSSAIVNSTEENISSVFETEEETSEAESTATEEFTSIPEESQPPDEESKPTIDENGSYTSRDDLALYIHTYERSPGLRLEWWLIGALCTGKVYRR